MALLTDLYQLTMAYGYWKAGKHEQQAIFNLFFRKNPFEGGYTVTAGLEYIMEYLAGFSFQSEDLDYLATLKRKDGSALFPDAFLDYLSGLTFSCDVWGMPEGTLAFPHEPVIKVRGPIIQCQILETPLLNLFNFSTLVATKAARIIREAKGQPVLEFGLRRAQGMDGALAASRAAYIGGCSSTSNVLAGKLFGIPVSGTHAHAWIMSFTDELEAFKAYAAAFPADSIFLVDTFDTREGIAHAIEAGKWLRQAGHELIGVRLDSGDLAYYSKLARAMLDEAGFPGAKIVASNDLDEYIINSLNNQGAHIQVWGIGTKLATAYDQPALGGVYKMAAIEESNGWRSTIKLSEQAIKVNTPGDLQVRRLLRDGQLYADVIYDIRSGLPDKYVVVDPMDATRRKKIKEASYEAMDLMQLLFKEGKRIYDTPAIEHVRELVSTGLEQLDDTVKRLVNPHILPVGLVRDLHEHKTTLMLEIRNHHDEF